MTALVTTVTINGAEPELPPRLYWIVQDKVARVERLVREDGAYWQYDENTLLPWAKNDGYKLKKVEDTDAVREFEFSLPAEVTPKRLPQLWRHCDRRDRVHVANVRGLKDKYVVVLSDGGTFDWDRWVTMDDDERNDVLYETLK